MSDVLRNKAATIERCVARVEEEYYGHESSLRTNFAKQDSIILNLERASQACIDMGTHLIRVKRLGIPQTSRDVFSMLEVAGIIDVKLSQTMQAMVGFRNIAVPDYQKLNLDIVEAIVQQHLKEMLEFSLILMKSE